MIRDLPSTKQLDVGIIAALETSILVNFPPALLDQILSESLRVHVPSGSVIYRDEEQPRCALVVDGLIRVFLTAPSDREITVRYASRGEMLGVPVMIGGPVPVSVQMLTDSVLLFLNIHTLQQLGKTNAQVAWCLAEEVTHRLYDTLEALAATAFGSLRQQVARHVLDLATTSEFGGQLVAAVTQQELADAVGSVRPAVSRIIGELRSEGFIDTTPRGIVIRDPVGLHAQTWSRRVSQL